MSAPAPSGGFSLFPSTGRPPSRTQQLRAPTPQQHQQAGNAAGSGRASPDPTPQFAAPPIGEAVTAEIRIPAPVADVQTRRGDNIQDPNRSSSVRSRSSIAKVRLSIYDDSAPIDEAPPPMPGQAVDIIEQQQAQQQQYQQQQQQERPPALRSIFPTYNPEVSLDEQDYFPTQTSPTRIPRAVISRPLYSPVSPDTQQQQHQHLGAMDPIPNLTLSATSPAQASVYSPLSAGVSSPGAVSSATTATPAARPWPVAARSGPTTMQREAPTLPVPSTSDDLRNFWKVANGWKAGPSEGRVYCLRMSCDKDSPMYRLSSANHQPFYRLRLDPTSMSAYVTLSRHDPARPFKIESSKNSGGGDASSSAAEHGDAGAAGSSRNSVLDMSPPGGSSVLGTSGEGGGGAADPQARFDSSKNWQVAMTTTLEEEARRHQPQDGLVALLYPAAATRMALERPNDAAMVMTAERECARLVWDDDSGSFFLVHPALALPFVVTIERSTTWSRTAYTLEHRESPQHLARLTRDGTGAGYLEVDTGIAAKIDAAYLVDVVVAALVLVAHSDGQFAQVEQFAPPPVPALAHQHHHGGGGGGSFGAGLGADGGSLVNMVMGGVGRSTSRLSSFGSRQSMRDGSPAPSKTGFFGGGKKKAKKGGRKAGRSRMEEFDLDLESQTSIDLSSKMFEMGPMNNTGGSGVPQGAGGGGGKAKRRGKKDDKDKMPGCLRLFTFLFKCCFWCVAMCVRALLAIVGGLFKCITSEKL